VPFDSGYAALGLESVIGLGNGLAVGTNAQAYDMNMLMICIGVANDDVRAGLQAKVFEQGFGNLAPCRRIEIGVFGCGGKHQVRNRPVQ